MYKNIGDGKIEDLAREERIKRKLASMKENIGKN